ncbi:MAG: hypothetical protein HY507_01085, partial [Candidatus Zambryskibacteria bacterium]|nr:hypothetical protein [Candidatus Zambryskibacteria bacterium]
MIEQFLRVVRIGGILSSDLAVLIIVFLAFFFYGMYFGRNMLVSLILSYYPSVFLFQNFPFIDKLIFLSGNKLVVLNKVVIFLIFLI